MGNEERPGGQLTQQADKTFEKYLFEKRIEFITFHPSYSYEEFIEGITVETGKENIPTETLKYKLRPGIFKNMCRRALGSAIGFPAEKTEEMSWKKVYANYSDTASSENGITFDSAPKYVLIIDEINRGDMAKIFGELITLLEADKRLGQENEITVTLPYSSDTFGVPPNLYIIATMNTADRSIALLDVALRRRFGFIEKNPDFEVLREEHLEKNRGRLGEGVYGLLDKSIKAIGKINEAICLERTIGRDKQIGHSFFFRVFTQEDLQLVWKYEILPLLEEYCYSDYRRINQMLFRTDFDSKWISESGGIGIIDDLNEMLEKIIGDD